MDTPEARAKLVEDRLKLQALINDLNNGTLPTPKLDARGRGWDLKSELKNYVVQQVPDLSIYEVRKAIIKEVVGYQDDPRTPFMKQRLAKKVEWPKPVPGDELGQYTWENLTLSDAIDGDDLKGVLDELASTAGRFNQLAPEVLRQGGLRGVDPNNPDERDGITVKTASRLRWSQGAWRYVNGASNSYLQQVIGKLDLTPSAEDALRLYLTNKGTSYEGAQMLINNLESKTSEHADLADLLLDSALWMRCGELLEEKGHKPFTEDQLLEITQLRGPLHPGELSDYLAGMYTPFETPFEQIGKGKFGPKAGGASDFLIKAIRAFPEADIHTISRMREERGPLSGTPISDRRALSKIRALPQARAYREKARAALPQGINLEETLKGMDNAIAWYANILTHDIEIMDQYPALLDTRTGILDPLEEALVKAQDQLGGSLDIDEIREKALAGTLDLQTLKEISTSITKAQNQIYQQAIQAGMNPQILPEREDQYLDAALEQATANYHKASFEYHETKALLMHVQARESHGSTEGERETASSQIPQLTSKLQQLKENVDTARSGRDDARRKQLGVDKLKARIPLNSHNTQKEIHATPER